MSLFEVRDLCVAYEGDGEKAPVKLESISFALDEGAVYDLTGPSGVGKSMLLRACAQMMPLKGGHLLLKGTASTSFTYQEWRRRVCLVPQRASLIPGTIRDNLLLPWTLKVNRGRTAPSDTELEQLLQKVLLDVPLDRDAAKLSGGQAARVALLRVFATKPSVMLLDEVDAALDDESALAVGKLTASLVGEGATCLRIRHRPPDGIASAIFQMDQGQLRLKEQGARSAHTSSSNTELPQTTEGDV